MKRIRNVLVVGLTVVLLGSVALAQDGDGPPRQRRGGGQGPRAARRGGDEAGGPRRGEGEQGPMRLAQPQRLEQVLRQLDLTEEQRAKISEILADNRAKMNAALEERRAEMQEAQQALRAARESGDEDALAAARQRLRELRPGNPQEGQEVIRRISAVLTKRQREKLIDLLGPGGEFAQLLQVIGAMDPPPEQAKQIRQIAAQARAEARMKTEPKEKGQVWAAARKKIIDLLTDEQKAELRRRMAARGRAGQGAEGMLEGLNLTDEQQKAVEAIHEEIRQKVEQAEPGPARREAMRAARAEARRRILNEVLTDQQKQQLIEQLMRERRGEGRPGGDPGGPGGEGRGGRRGEGPGGEGRGGRRGGGPAGNGADLE